MTLRIPSSEIKILLFEVQCSTVVLSCEWRYRALLLANEMKVLLLSCVVLFYSVSAGMPYNYPRRALVCMRLL